MKLIDRYILRSFLSPLVFCLLGFTMVYVVFDMFDHLSDFVAGQVGAASMAVFYLYLLPLGAIYVAPVSLMMATLYSLTQLTKNNELTAMRACGMSLYRLMLPYVTAGLLASVAVLLINETLSPRAAYWTRQFVRAAGREDKLSVHLARNVPYKNQRERRTWMIGQFNALDYSMENVEVFQHDARGMDLYKVTAPRVEWRDRRWQFRDLTKRYFDAYGNPRGAPELALVREMHEFTETPVNFLNEIKDPVRDPEFFAATDLLNYIESHDTLGPPTVRRLMVDFHHRLALPWTCLIVTLLGIPFGNHTGRKGSFAGAMLCLGLFFFQYFAINFGLWLGKQGGLPPWLAAWLPIALLLAYGAHLLARMR